MSIEQRKMLTDGAMWVFRLGLGVIAWFAVETFREVQTEIHDMRIDVKEIGRDLNQVEQRVSRIEGKLEQK